MRPPQSRADEAHPRFLASAWFPALDGLRALSILPVVWHHATPRPLPGLLGKGPVGVDLFFAISGFLITTLLLRERRATGSIALGAFYARRGLRIFPLYYAVLAAHVAYAWALPAAAPERAHFFESLPAYLTYTSNWLVDWSVPHAVIFAFSWSLATEEQFYLLWPPLLRLLRRRGAALAAMLSFIALDLAVERAPGLLSPLLHRVVTSFAAPIGLGACLAVLADDPAGFRALYALLGRRASAPLALAAVLGLLAWDGAPLFAVHVALSLLVASCTLRPDHGLRRVTSAPLLVSIGVVSYGIYLFHVPVIGLLRRVAPPLRGSAPALFALAFPVTWGLALLSHRHFERRFLDLRRRFRRPG